MPAHAVWDPHHTTEVAALKKVQKFALRLCTKNWTHSNCSFLLKQCNLPTLETRRLYLKLCTAISTVASNQWELCLSNCTISQTCTTTKTKECRLHIVCEANFQHKCIPFFPPTYNIKMEHSSENVQSRGSLTVI